MFLQQVFSPRRLVLKKSSTPAVTFSVVSVATAYQQLGLICISNQEVGVRREYYMPSSLLLLYSGEGRKEDMGKGEAKNKCSTRQQVWIGITSFVAAVLALDDDIVGYCTLFPLTPANLWTLYQIWWYDV